MTDNSIILAFSGGLDSTVLLHKAIKESNKVYTISFDYGQRHIKELNCIDFYKQKLNIDNQVVKLPFLSNFKGTALTDKGVDVPIVKNMIGEAQSSAYFPNRNTIFLSILAGYAESVGCNTVWYGAAQADSVAGFYDGSPEFLVKINELNSLNRKHRILVEAPLIDKSKKEIIQLGVSLEVDFSKTWTCYQGKDLPCGECPACSLRLKGFIDAEYIDPLKYQIQDKLEKIYEENNCITPP